MRVPHLTTGPGLVAELHNWAMLFPEQGRQWEGRRESRRQEKVGWLIDGKEIGKQEKVRGYGGFHGRERINSGAAEIRFPLQVLDGLLLYIQILGNYPMLQAGCGLRMWTEDGRSN